MASLWYMVVVTLGVLSVAPVCLEAEPWSFWNSDSEEEATPPRGQAARTPPQGRPVSRCASSRASCQNLDSGIVTNINQQIQQEFFASYVYLAMANYLSQDNVALRGFSKFFRKASDEERMHGLKLVDYLNKRGGLVSFSSIPAPAKLTWTGGKEVVNDALALEKRVNGKLLDLHWNAQHVNDPHLQDFLEGEYLPEQVEGIKQLSDWSTILTKFGNNSLGEHIFDQELLDGKR